MRLCSYSLKNLIQWWLFELEDTMEISRKLPVNSVSRWNAKKIYELSNNYEFCVILKANQKTNLLQKNAKKEMKKHYIKLNWIYAWAGPECFSICQRLHIKREGLNKKYFLACIISNGSNGVSQLWKNIILGSITHSQISLSSCEQKFSKKARGWGSS